MAHSLRSKSKLKAKKVKTSNPNSDYFKTQESRSQRLAEKLKENLEKQAAAKVTATDSKDSDEMDTDTPKELQTPAEELVNVKTHGWRKSRAANYKKKKASKKNKSLKF